MPALVITCEHCGARIDSGIRINDATNASVADVKSWCPNCRNYTGGSDGVYSTVKGVLVRIGDLEPTRDEVASLLAVLQSHRAAAGPVAVTQDIAEAAPRIAGVVNPLLGELADNWAVKLPLIVLAFAQVIALLDAPNRTTASAAFAHVVAAAVPFLQRRKQNE
jgi:hypothetical protein